MQITTTRWFKFIRTVIMYLLIFWGVMFVTDWYRSQNIDADFNVAPQITMMGKPIDIKSLSYQEPVLVYYWASWCGICSLVSPTVAKFADNTKVVTVALQSGDDNELAQLIKERGYQFDPINDNSGALAASIGIVATPTVMIIKDGKVSSVTVGVTSWFGIWSRLLLAKL